MERIILCILCGIGIGLLAGRFYWKYAETRRRKRLPICEVRKAPDVLYVHEKKPIGEASTGVPQEQKEHASEMTNQGEMKMKKKTPAGEGRHFVEIRYLKHGVSVSKRFWQRKTTKRRQQPNHRMRHALIRAKK